MAYQIEYTSSIWGARRLRKLLLRLSILALLAAAAWGVYDIYTTYKKPTLNMKLADYELVARPIEEMNAAWDEAQREYRAMLRYYRFIWAANPTNFLGAMVAADAPRLGRGFRPVTWTLATGGKCQLDYSYVFDHGDKATQAKGIEASVVHVVTSVVEVVSSKVEVQGVQLENLLNVDELNLSVRFSLPDVKSFPAKEGMIVKCVDEIVAQRKKILDSKLFPADRAKDLPGTAREIMLKYLPIGKDKPEYPVFTNVIDVAGWFDRADSFIARNRIPGTDDERQKLRAAWNEIGDARFPWDRYRSLDTEELVSRTKALGAVSDGVKRFKVFLEQRHANCRRKLEPFTEAYDHDDVFNKPFIETDLRSRVLKSLGILHARVAFKDESGAEPVGIVKGDERFSFSWVRWTLTIGEAVGADAAREQANGESAPPDQITLTKLAECVRKTLELGPGYALDTVKISFNAGGDVSGAVLEGLLPVKKAESLKGAGK